MIESALEKDISERLIPFAPAVHHSDPYPLVIAEAALTDKLAAEMLTWLETGVEWQLHHGGFFQQWERSLLGLEYPDALKEFFAPEALRALCVRIGMLFGADMSFRMTVVAHKLVRGQAIGVHNDEPDPGYETHRLVIQLNRLGEQESGGALRIHRSRDEEDVAFTVRPRHNSAVAFEMSRRSYHSVQSMGDWERYSLVFSFWTKESASVAERLEADYAGAKREFDASTVAAALPDDELDRLERLVALLSSLETDRRSHSGGNLLEHLLATYLILRSWNCSVDLATAGLFHSIYGTEAYRTSTLGIDDREKLRALIGARPERLAYLFCAGTKESLYRLVLGSRLGSLVDANTGEEIPISLTELTDLIALDLANSLEQWDRVGGLEECVALERRVYSAASDMLPAAALPWIERTYGAAT